MLSTHADEVLSFIREFETASRDYLLSQGLSEYEMTNAYLDLQWAFLHTILKQQQNNSPNKSHKRILRSHQHAI